jgi:hypothetical protein
MILSRLLTAFRRACSAKRTAQPALPTSRLALEQLEDRVTPSILNVSVSINPNIFTMSLQETLTATITATTGETGSPTGTVSFNVNNQVQNIAVSGNQATATYTIPLFTALSGQALSVLFNPDTTSTFSSSAFLAPLFLNLENFVFSSNITFGAPTASFSNFTTSTGMTTSSFNSQFGETDVVQFGFIPVTFNYAQDGSISTVSFLGVTFPGFFAAGIINPLAPVVFPVPSSS